jgi:RNA polymerase sigma-70 factor, ECF subfamily
MMVFDREASAEPHRSEPQDEVLRLYANQATALYRFCRSLVRTREEAEDVVQETFLKLLRHLQGDGDRRNLRAWLFTVAANGCRDRIRGRWRWVPWTAESDARTVTPLAQSGDPEERRQAVPEDQAPARRALATLGPRDRLLLSLRAQGLSYADIARAAGIRPVSVGRLLARAVDRWKRAAERFSPS